MGGPTIYLLPCHNQDGGFVAITDSGSLTDFPAAQQLGGWMVGDSASHVIREYQCCVTARVAISVRVGGDQPVGIV